jgi:hypothetical protein
MKPLSVNLAVVVVVASVTTVGHLGHSNAVSIPWTDGWRGGGADQRDR